MIFEACMTIRIILISPSRDAIIIKSDGTYYMLYVFEELDKKVPLKYGEVEVNMRLGYTPSSVIVPSMESAWEYLYGKFKRYQVDNRYPQSLANMADRIYNGLNKRGR
jgi:hypothetical protein